jgi:hypothetical protein
VARLSGSVRPFVPAPFLRELYAGEEYSRRALRLVAFFPTWPTSRQRRRSWRGAARVGRLTANDATWRDRAPTCGHSVPKWLLQLGDVRLFAFPAATAPRRWGKREHTAQPRGLRRAVEGSPGHDGSKHDANPRTPGGLNFARLFLASRPRIRIIGNYHVPPFFETVAVSPVELAF